MAEAIGGGEHDERDVDVAEDGELVGLLDEAIPPLREGHLPVRVVLDPLDLQLHAPHNAPRSADEKEHTLARLLQGKKRRAAAPGMKKMTRSPAGVGGGSYGRRREFVGRARSTCVTASNKRRESYTCIDDCSCAAQVTSVLQLRLTLL